MTKSFYNREDTDLAHKLSAELSGIFNWAMQGLQRRVARGGHFLQPESGKDLLEVMAELGNPLGAFVDEALEFDPEGTVGKDEVFACFKHWAIKKNMPFGTEQSFKRRFLASTQEHMVESDLVRNNGTRKHIYRGVKLNEKAQKYVDANIINEEGVF